MTGWQTLGAMLVATPFVAIVVMGIRTTGWKIMTAAALSAIGITCMVFAGVWLLSGGAP